MNGLIVINGVIERNAPFRSGFYTGIVRQERKNRIILRFSYGAAWQIRFMRFLRLFRIV